MRGVVLAGGLGSRLDPLTRVTNKHLLPVYNKPIIYYPLFTLKEAGIKDILIVVGGNSSGDFLELLGDGSELGLHLTFRFQEKPAGIAQALSLAEGFTAKEKFVVVLGDNILTGSIKNYVHKFFADNNLQAFVLLKKVKNPQRFGVAVLKENKIIKIEEKPQEPKSNLAVIGVYMYDNFVFKIIKNLKPSARGELEISDVHNVFLQNKTLGFAQYTGDWTDAGTFASLLEANNLIARKEKKGLL